MIQINKDISELYLRSNLLKGDVLIWENFPFNSKESKTSRFLILTSCKENNFLAVRGTTNIEYYNKPHRIKNEFFILEKGIEISFPEKTVFDLKNIKLLPVDDMKKIFGSGLKKGEKISDECLAKIIFLVKNSYILEQYYIEWILSS